MKQAGKIFLAASFLFITLFSAQVVYGHEDHAGENTDNMAVIYFNEACGACSAYLREEFPEMISPYGIAHIIEKDYVNEKENRAQMNAVLDDYAIPLELRSHIMAIVNSPSASAGYTNAFIFGGHIPKHIVDDLLSEENSGRFKRIVVYQDKMHGEVSDYRVYAIPLYADTFVGKPKTYPINTSVTEYLDYLEENESELSKSVQGEGEYMNSKRLLPMVLVSGLLDGINPCAFAVLLFFIAFLFSLGRTRSMIWKMGAVYISSIYLAYLLIGFGIMKAILFTNTPHFMAQVGAWLVIGLGVINLLNYYFPKFPIRLRMPHASKDTISEWMYKATIPAAFVLGFLVGLCTFPCSGGIYVAIIGLLASRTTYWQGTGYLLLYNLMFVVPLIAILLLSANKAAVEKLSKMEQSESGRMRFFAAITMILLGIIILVFFT